MTGGRCHRRRKMMGRGADGGCGTEERPCRPVPRVPSTIPTKPTNDYENLVSSDIDFFSQARKALCERGPFDVPEDGSSSGLGVPTLPSGFANLLKQSDNRKRHKKSHSGADKKSSRQGEKSRAGRIWVETEEYFRNIALADIDVLSELYSLRSLVSKKCFSIPFVGNRPEESDANVSCEKSEEEGNGAHEVGVQEEVKNAVKEGVDGIDVREVNTKDVGAMEIEGSRVENLCSISEYSGSLESILGVRSRILFTSERHSKKRKLLSRDAGLDKLLAAFPCDHTSSFCDFCCTGETGRNTNKLIVCSSCQVVVHKKCYGVREDIDESWRCSCCRQKNGSRDLDSPCVLCPKSGGALKPISRKMESSGPVQFAHLFCSLWVPEVYVEDLSKMEPILNLEGVNEARRKLVCSLCKMKSGFCVRCSNGTCRTFFHPICAREAKQRLEIWEKDGCDIIELRAFCSKHSSLKEGSISVQAGNGCVAAGDDSYVSTHLPSQWSEDSHENGDKMTVDEGILAARSDVLGDSELQEMEFHRSEVNVPISDGSKVQHVELGLPEMINSERVDSDSLSFAILKKFIERGKVKVEHVAEEIGISPNLLSAKTPESDLAPDLRFKIARWLSKHAYLGSFLQKGVKVKIRSGVPHKLEPRIFDCAEDVAATDSHISDPVATESLALQGINQSKSRDFKDDNMQCISSMGARVNESVMNEAKADKSVEKGRECSPVTSICCADEKRFTKPDKLQDSIEEHLSLPECDPTMPSTGDLSIGDELKDTASPDRKTFPGQFICSDLNLGLLDLIVPFPGFYVHPCVRSKLFQVHTAMLTKNRMPFDGSGTTSDVDGTEGEMLRLQASSNASVCCNHHVQHPECNDRHGRLDNGLPKSGELRILELSPEDELEGELIYHQYQLLGNLLSRKQLSDNLVRKALKSLQHEINLQRQQTWDNVAVSQYFRELREAKKQGRKEKKHMEAQAVLAAATAAAAASSRVSSLRKDGSEEPASQEDLVKTSASSRRAGLGSHFVPQAGETLSVVAVSRQPSEKQSDISEIPGENPRSCDICQRFETMWNLVSVCSGCKVAVHLDCYRNVRESTGPWECELCEEKSSSRLSGALSVNPWEKPHAECALCGGATGAFRKATNGQWVHALCAEWIFESTFRRGQVDLVRGMETLPIGIAICCICHRKYGACIKCSYGHCQATYHPSCARSAGFYMTGGGKFPHKAYCEKHSLEQKAKAEAQKHGPEEMKNLKQYRVELERLRLLCERIIKREKLKRELVLCSHEILAVRRDHAPHTLLRTPFLPPDISSESATTSLKGHQDSYKSGSEAIQRSDDITVDSALSVKRRNKGLVPMDIDHRTDDSATSQNCFARKTTERANFGGKTIPRRHALATNLRDDTGRSNKTRKHIETFAKELVMTSDEASMKNRRLPKGYFYVPVDQLQEKQTDGDEVSGRDG